MSDAQKKIYISHHAAFGGKGMVKLKQPGKKGPKLSQALRHHVSVTQPAWHRHRFFPLELEECGHRLCRLLCGVTLRPETEWHETFGATLPDEGSGIRSG